jgi:histidine ammonia-lyase
VVLGLQPQADNLPQEAAYYVTTGPDRGAVLPTSNFESLPWVVSLESLNIALAHLSRASAERINRLDDPEMTHLTRFLAPDGTTLAFSAIQKVYVALDSQDEELTNPISETSLPVAGGIEDVSSNAPVVAQRTVQLVDNLHYMLGIELMHAAQAIDLRRQQDPALSMGRGTSATLAAFRAQVPFLDHDRALTPDITAAHDFLAGLP